MLQKNQLKKVKIAILNLKKTLLIHKGYLEQHYKTKREKRSIMGWVVLTLRKTELKRTHADYQMDLLRISRQKRQMAREKHYNQTVTRNQQSAATRELKNIYNEQKDSINGEQGTYTDINSLFDLSKYTNDDNNIETGNTETSTGNWLNHDFSDLPNRNSTGNSGDYALGQGVQDDNDTESTTSTSSSSSSSNLTSQERLNLLDQAKEDYVYLSNEVKTYFEDELEMIEEEASEEETYIDQEQAEIEAMLESISQEMESVGQAVSSQIQSSTIKLS